MILETIHDPRDIKSLNDSQTQLLCTELREFLLKSVSKTGGHLASNLGAVELTVAIHRVFDTSRDRLVFDVGHQCYTHKILTGRREQFSSLRQYGGLSGFPKPRESGHDAFIAGHASNSVSVALGMARARTLQHQDYSVLALIGDGALSGGLAYEGLNDAGASGEPLIVILNDNEMSIAPNHGGIYKGLAELRATNGTSERNLFKAFGLDYRYVADGNDVQAMIAALREVKDIDHPVVVHIHTDKGHGLDWAEHDKESGHWVLPAKVLEARKAQPAGESYAELSRRYLMDKMRQDRGVVVISAGTPGVGGFGPKERAEAGSQFVDVGIAEQNAVAEISGIAKAGGKPVFEVTASFLQRAYDQLQQDLGLQGSAATIIVSGYGDAIGPGDNTHANYFPIAMTNTIPGLTGLAPATKEEYLAMLDWAIDHAGRPVVIAEPGTLTTEADLRGLLGAAPAEPATEPFTQDQLNMRTIARGSDVAILALGNFLPLGLKVREALARKGIDATVIDPRVYSDLDVETLDALQADHRIVVTLEDGSLAGGFGQQVAAYYGPRDMKVLSYGAAKELTDLEPTESLYRRYRLKSELIVEDVLKAR